MSRFSKRRVLIVGIMLVIAAFHLLPIEDLLHGGSLRLYFSYFSDLVLPFAAYFLLRLMEREIAVLRRWTAKLAAAFLMPSIAETCQYFGIPVLGSTFDPLDYLMYALGAVSAAMVDIQVFSRLLPFWRLEKVDLK